MTMDNRYRWHPVATEGMPIVGARYLVTNGDWGSWEVDIDIYSEEVNDFLHYRHVVAWMPLIEPYKEKVIG